jgi:hypothetical protein
MNSTLKSLLFWMALVILGAGIWHFSASMQSSADDITYTQFRDHLRSRQVESVEFTGNEVVGTLVGSMD